MSRRAVTAAVASPVVVLAVAAVAASASAHVTGAWWRGGELRGGR